MNDKQRSTVASLLRAVATTSDTIHEYVHRLYVDYSDNEGEIAELAREAAVDSWTEFNGSDAHYNESCLRAAKLVEDGWTPPTDWSPE